ncbi:MAG: alpha/beta hydrolase [Pelosinus sp.]|nr:alpha/beta hydrolase [Pelosinus sp.]
MQSNAKVQIEKRKRWRWLLAGLVLILFLVNGFGLFVGNMVYQQIKVLQSVLPIRKSMELQQQMDFGKRQKQWQDVMLTSRYGYPLRGTYIPNPQPTDKTVVFLHGFTESRLSGLYYLGIYLDAGFNLLLVDSRAHGESGGNSVTWGVYEKYDLDQWVNWLKERFPGGTIGVHGVSMGAATALLHAELNEPSKKVSFYIADSAYSDLETLLNWELGRRKQSFGTWLPSQFILPYANAAAYLTDRFTFYQASPLRALSSVTTPVLYIHGQDDRLIPVSMAYELYNATKGPRKISIFRQGGHADGVFQDWGGYNEIIQNFISEVEE